MDGVKARLPGRLAACLLILDVRTDKVLKVWYENDWDAFSTKVSVRMYVCCFIMTSCRLWYFDVCVLFLD